MLLASEHVGISLKDMLPLFTIAFVDLSLIGLYLWFLADLKVTILNLWWGISISYLCTLYLAIGYFHAMTRPRLAYLYRTKRAWLMILPVVFILIVKCMSLTGEFGRYNRGKFCDMEEIEVVASLVLAIVVIPEGYLTYVRDTLAIKFSQLEETYTQQAGQERLFC
ncbi:hypothetical protein BGX23_009565 [Mortierella sp. AD031]|nr:hypothetical protein BGX23_009565 [Mortierella sp. AD031]